MWKCKDGAQNELGECDQGTCAGLVRQKRVLEKVIIQLNHTGCRLLPSAKGMSVYGFICIRGTHLLDDSFESKDLSNMSAIYCHRDHNQSHIFHHRLTFVQHPPKMSEAIKTILAQEGTVACTTAATIPESFFVLGLTVSDLSVVWTAVVPFARPLTPSTRGIV